MYWNYIAYFTFEVFVFNATRKTITSDLFKSEKNTFRSHSLCKRYQCSRGMLHFDWLHCIQLYKLGKRDKWNKNYRLGLKRIDKWLLFFCTFEIGFSGSLADLFVVKFINYTETNFWNYVTPKNYSQVMVIIA